MDQIVRDKRVVFKLSKGELKELERAAKSEPNCSSRSDFIRLAITQKIHGVLDREAVEDLDVGLDDDAIERIDDSVESVSEQVARLSEEFTEVLEEGLTDDDEIDKLARDIYHNLPVLESSDEFEYLESFHIVDAEDHLDRAQYASTPSAWAKWFGKPKTDARRACRRMTEYYPGDVEWVHESWEHEDGYEVAAPERRYYRTPESVEEDDE